MQRHEPHNEKRKSDRRHTDESLVVERKKTNDSISESRHESEIQTDTNVESKRDAADRKTSDDRSSEDSSLPASSELREERSSSDRKVKLERTIADAAIKKERAQSKESTTEFLKQERGETDKNLKIERDEYDVSSKAIQKHLSEEISEHLKTKVSVTTRDELIAILSHDLRNPIGAISTSAELLQMEIKEPSHKNLIELIKRNANTAIQLIQDIFEMENISQGNFDLKLERHNLLLLLKECIESFAHAAAAKKLTLELLPADDVVEVVFDRGRLWQVISNILGNAIKFTQESGRIVISLKATSDEAHISIADNGPGIPADKLDEIFNRFSQIASKNRTGLGLGLYISKIFVEAHGGKIHVDSTPGKGSTFHIILNRRLGVK